MASPNDLRKGSVIRYQGNPHVVLDFVHRAQGRRMGFIQATLRNLTSGSSTVVKFDSSDEVYFCETENMTLDFSYVDEQGYHFMDPNTFEDVLLSADLIGDDKFYLVPNHTYDIRIVDGKPAQISLPSYVELKVMEAPEVIRGDTATNVLKKTITETGLEVKTPAFIKAGEVIKVSTLDGSYMSRA